MTRLERIVAAEVPIYPELLAVIENEGINVEEHLTENERDVKGKILASWGFKYFRELCDEYGIQPVWVFVPAVSKNNWLDEYVSLARNAGFEDFILLEGVYNNYHQTLLQVAKDDKHPNALGHRLIADGLYRELVEYLGLNNNPEEKTETVDK
jgi:lysophospholipase L1-like esterase